MQGCTENVAEVLDFFDSRSVIEPKRVQNRILHRISVVNLAAAYLAESVFFVEFAGWQIRFANFEQNG